MHFHKKNVKRGDAYMLAVSAVLDGSLHEMRKS